MECELHESIRIECKLHENIRIQISEHCSVDFKSFEEFQAFVRRNSPYAYEKMSVLQNPKIDLE